MLVNRDSSIQIAKVVVFIRGNMCVVSSYLQKSSVGNQQPSWADLCGGCPASWGLFILTSPFARKGIFGLLFFLAAGKSVFFLEVLWQFF